MTDLERWKLRGPVRTLNTEIAEWDQSAGSWGAPRHLTEVTFDVEGRLLHLEQPGPAGAVARSTYLYNAHGQLSEIQHGTSIGAVTSVWRHEYDGAGRLAEVLRTTADGARVVVKTNTYDPAGRRSTTEALPPEGPNMAVSASIDGSELGYSAPGAVKIMTNYDPLGNATDASFLDATGRVLRRVTVCRDEAGRITREDARAPDDAPLDFSKAFESISPEEHAKVVALFRTAFDATVTTYAYDAAGRVVERTTRLGQLQEQRITYRYDDRDNPIETCEEDHSREIGLNDEGEPTRVEQPVRTRVTRFEYTYDQHSNWTERIVSARVESDAPFRPSNVERRVVSYY